VVFAIGMPFLQSINVHVWQAGESIVLNSEQVVAKMQDQNVANAAQSAINAQKANFSTNIEITGFMNQWAWLFIALIIFIVIFIQIRQEKELDRSGF